MNAATRALIVEALMTAAHVYNDGVDRVAAADRKSAASKLMMKATRVAEIAQLIEDGHEDFVCA